MAENEKLQEASEAQPERVWEVNPTEDFDEYYATSARVVIGFYDIRLAFGQIVEASEERLAIQEAVSIIMTPELAKSLVPIFQQHIELYEREFGTIRTPPTKK